MKKVYYVTYKTTCKGASGLINLNSGYVEVDSKQELSAEYFNDEETLKKGFWSSLEFKTKKVPSENSTNTVVAWSEVKNYKSKKNV